MTQARNEVSLVIGTIERIFQPREFNGKLSPGKIVMNTKDGKSVVSVWQIWDRDSVKTEEMPSLWTSLDFDWSIGKKVAISCKFDNDWSDANGNIQHQYILPRTGAIKYLDGDPPQSSQTEGAVRTGVSGTEDTVSTKPSSPQPSNQLSLDERIAWNSAINNSINAYSSQPPGHWSTSTRSYLKLVVKLANEIYPEIRRGPEVEPEPEPEPEEEAETSFFDEPSDLGLGVVGLIGEI